MDAAITKSDRMWAHWLYWLDANPFGPDLLPIHGYEPEKWRNAFERFQTHGISALSDDEVKGIHPLREAQKTKEITLTSLAEESMEWWANGWGWIHPWNHTLDGDLDEITRKAIQKTMDSIRQDPVGFFDRHPGISQEVKNRYFTIRIQSLDYHKKTA